MKTDTHLVNILDNAIIFMDNGTSQIPLHNAQNNN